MIAEFGLAALWLAAAFALLQAFAGIGHWRGFSPALASLTRPVAVVQRCAAVDAPAAALARALAAALTLAQKRSAAVRARPDFAD